MHARFGFFRRCERPLVSRGTIGVALQILYGRDGEPGRNQPLPQIDARNLDCRHPAPIGPPTGEGDAHLLVTKRTGQIVLSRLATRPPPLIVRAKLALLGRIEALSRVF
jgi:hypothetical protein